MTAMTESLRALAADKIVQICDDLWYERIDLDTARARVADALAGRLASPGAGAVERFQPVGKGAMVYTDTGDYVTYAALAARDAEIAGLRQRVEAAKANERRYLWLRERQDSVDWFYGEPPRAILAFHIPSNMRVSANLDLTIDAELPKAAAQQAEPTGGRGDE